jgi:hypothetical protein
MSLASEVGGVAHLVLQAYTDGLRIVMWFSAALVVAAFVLVLRFVPASSEGEATRGGDLSSLV